MKKTFQLLLLGFALTLINNYAPAHSGYSLINIAKADDDGGYGDDEGGGDDEGPSGEEGPDKVADLPGQPGRDNPDNRDYNPDRNVDGTPDNPTGGPTQPGNNPNNPGGNNNPTATAGNPNPNTGNPNGGPSGTNHTTLSSNSPFAKITRACAVDWLNPDLCRHAQSL
ncbi:MAG: hypothetical protein K1X44_06690 [Alphaproteobacteria bacterium]|nr:hypothetical protein [Alphaproteobacteria bacterium]